MWSGEYLGALMTETGMSLDNVSRATKIPASTLYAYLQGRVSPSLYSLTAIADYFAVPLDYLAGRMPKDKAKELIENYSETFMELRKAPYEAYLSGRKQMRLTDLRSNESPWPYNLLDAVFGKPWETLLTEDQKKGIEYAVSTLDERMQLFIQRYYRDGKTLDKIGTENGVTRERVRQIVAKACHMLRHPSRSVFIKMGYDSAYESVKNSETARRLTEVERELDAKQRELENRQQELDRWDAVLKECSEKQGDITLYDLDLTVRATNILRRKGAKTLKDVVDILETGNFGSYRGVGKGTLREVVDKVSYITGKDYSDIYAI